MQTSFFDHHIQPTTRAGYDYIKPKIGNRQREVYDILLKAVRPVTNLEISKALDRPINAITPRVKELREMGIVIDCGKIKTAFSPVPSLAWAIRGRVFK